MTEDTPEMRYAPLTLWDDYGCECSIYLLMGNVAQRFTQDRILLSCILHRHALYAMREVTEVVDQKANHTAGHLGTKLSSHLGIACMNYGVNTQMMNCEEKGRVAANPLSRHGATPWLRDFISWLRRRDTCRRFSPSGTPSFTAKGAFRGAHTKQKINRRRCSPPSTTGTPVQSHTSRKENAAAHAISRVAHRGQTVPYCSRPSRIVRISLRVSSQPRGLFSTLPLMMPYFGRERANVRVDEELRRSCV